MILEFYRQEIVEVDGEWYISVKGIANAYEKHYTTIHKHLNKYSDIFESHFIDLKNSADREKFYSHFTKDQIISHGKWLDKFGTLLNSSKCKNICYY